MEKIQVQQISKSQAAARMNAAGLASPDGLATPESIAKNGECFELTHGAQSGVFVVEKNGARLWVSGAAAVASAGLVGVGLPVIEEIGRQSRCECVGFQTGRRGLARLARKQGYRVVGFIMEKSI